MLLTFTQWLAQDVRAFNVFSYITLRAVLAGVAPKAAKPQQEALHLLSCGNQRAIASWGSWAVQGQWVGWIKDWIDRRFVKQHSQG